VAVVIPVADDEQCASRLRSAGLYRTPQRWSKMLTEAERSEVYHRVREGGGELGVGPVVVDGVEGVCVVVRVAEDGQVVGLERTEGIRLRTGRDERWARHRTSYVYSSDKHIRVHIYFRCCCVRRPVPRPCRRTAPRRGGGRSGGRRWWSKSTGPCSTRRSGRGSRR